MAQNEIQSRFEPKQEHGAIQALRALPSAVWEALGESPVAVAGASGFVGSMVFAALMLAKREEMFRGEVLALSSQILEIRKNFSIARWGKFKLENWKTLESKTLESLGKGRLLCALGSSVDESKVSAQDLLAQHCQEPASLAARCAAAGWTFALASSGAVYGNRQVGEGPALETDAPLRLGHEAGCAYAKAKLLAESLCAKEMLAAPEDFKALRYFSFLGWGLPVRPQWAAWSFAKSLKEGTLPDIQSPHARRSWMSPWDMAAWSIALMALGEGGAWNVGSGRSFALRELAYELRINAQFDKENLLPGVNPEASGLWPDVSKAKNLGLRETLSMEEKTKEFWLWAKDQA